MSLDKNQDENLSSKLNPINLVGLNNNICLNNHQKSIIKLIKIVNENILKISLNNIENYLLQYLDIIIEGNNQDFIKRKKELNIKKSLGGTIRFSNFSFFGDLFRVTEFEIDSKKYIRIGRVQYPNYNYKVDVSEITLSRIVKLSYPISD
jgi:hypothetical protein